MATIGPALAARLAVAAPHESFEVTVFLQSEGEMDAQSFAATARADVPGLLRSRGHARRQKLIADLSEHASNVEAFAVQPAPRRIEEFWISHAVCAEVGRQTIEYLKSLPDVVHIELNRHASPSELFDDGDLAPAAAPAPAAAGVSEPTWNVKRVGAPLLWAEGLTGEGVVVAVVDSGVNYLHPDLAPNMWDGGAEFPNHGYDFDADDTDPQDDNGHGTNCAGIVAGTGASGKATGVAPGATIMAVRVGGSEWAHWRALQFVIDHHADVISMSLTWKHLHHPDYVGWRRVSESILAAGIAHANSCGNEGEQTTLFPVPFNIGAPGNCPSPLGGGAGRASAITCGSADDLDALDPRSGVGPSGWSDSPFADYPFGAGAPGLVKPDICAPGKGGIDTCSRRFAVTGKPYTSFSGTSAATPHVAGCLALLIQACKRASTPVVLSRLQEAIEETAVIMQSQASRKENTFGAGRIDVFQAWKFGRHRSWW